MLVPIYKSMEVSNELLCAIVEAHGRGFNPYRNEFKSVARDLAKHRGIEKISCHRCGFNNMIGNHDCATVINKLQGV